MKIVGISSNKKLWHKINLWLEGTDTRNTFQEADDKVFQHMIYNKSEPFDNVLSKNPKIPY